MIHVLLVAQSTLQAQTKMTKLKDISRVKKRLPKRQDTTTTINMTPSHHQPLPADAAAATNEVRNLKYRWPQINVIKLLALCLCFNLALVATSINALATAQEPPSNEQVDPLTAVASSPADLQLTTQSNSTNDINHNQSKPSYELSNSDQNATVKQQQDPAARYPSLDESSEENNDEDELHPAFNFSLMNAAHDKLQTVKNLLGLPNSDTQTAQSGDQLSMYGAESGSNHNQMTCIHKGRQYQHGQQVPIEDQPCLSCTCKRAILQCYLRVCPPVLSVEAHRRQMAATATDGQTRKCRLVKEPHQCCPTTKCEPMDGSSDSKFNSTMQNQSQYQNQQPARASDLNVVSIHSHQQVAAVSGSFLDGNYTNLASSTRDERSGSGQHQLVANRSISAGQDGNSNDLMTQASQVTTSASILNDSSQLPKLTVINGPAGQRDSILLITSNPNGSTATARLPANPSSQLAVTGGGGGQSREQNSGAILDALLEAVYSSAAQLNGLNLQGSCMINGSLYIEGSAVIPEGNAHCQYCYCIRQKVMCVRPKCHLYISGCNAKYDTEFACCPTSYSCTSTLSGNENSNELAAVAARATQASGSYPQSLQAKLSAAIESISRMSQHPLSARSASSSSNLNSSQELPMTDRSMDSGVQSGIATATPQSQRLPAAVLSLMDSINLSTEDPPTARTMPPPTTITPTSTITSTSTSTTTTTTTSTTTPTPKPSTTANESEGEEGDDESEEEGGEGGEEIKVLAPEITRKPTKKRVSLNKKRLSGGDGGQQVAVNSTGKTEQQSSISDFLEPMNKLGPLMPTPGTGVSVCLENGRQYAIGEQIPTIENCKHCYCGPEGLKECKMIECSLKISHNCEPVIPQGHCCPIRYECPGSDSTSHQFNNHSRANFNGQQVRYRSDDYPFGEAHQCNTSNLSGDCAQNSTGSSNPSTTTTLATPLNTDVPISGSVEDIRGLSVSNDGELPDIPLIKTTRLVDEDAEVQQQQLQPPGSSRNLTVTTTGASGIPDELNKFIMQINQLNNVNLTGGTSHLGPDYTFVNTNGSLANQTELRAQQPVLDLGFTREPLTTPSFTTTFSTVGNDVTANINNNLVDYHSVQAQPNAPLIPKGMVGIPSIEPEPVRGDDLLSTTNVGGGTLTGGSSVEYNLPNPSFSSQQGQRDSRSTNAHRMMPHSMANSSLLIDELARPQNSSSMLLDLKENDQPELVTMNLSDDYIDTADNFNLSLPRGTNNDHHHNQPTSRIVKHRSNDQLQPASLARESPHPMPHLRLLNLTNLPAARPAVVDFDDDLSNNTVTPGSSPFAHLSSGSNSGSGGAHSAKPGDSQPAGPSLVNLNSPENNLSYSIGNSNMYNNDSNNNSSNSPVLASSRATSGLDIDEPGSTPQPPQPTTGTPIGLDADRSHETSGWLKSLQNRVASFGRRLVASSPEDGLAGAASGGLKHEDSEPEVRETGRSQPSLLNQLISSVFEEVTNKKEERSNLVMRPLQNTMTPTPTSTTISPSAETMPSVVPDHRQVASGEYVSMNINRPIPVSPYDVSSAASSLLPSGEPIEIITAAVPSDPEVFGPLQRGESQGVQQRRVATSDGLIELSSSTSPPIQSGGGVNTAATSFSRRSDIGDVDAELNEEQHQQVAISNANRQAQQVHRQVVRLYSNVSAADNNIQEKTKSKLTCYDPLAGRIYQQGEHIPKADPCKSCVCVAGTELCQQRTCPEKQGENCKEERQPGECCPNYVCLGTASGSGNKMVVDSVAKMQQQPPTRALGPEPEIGGGRLIASSAGAFNNIQQSKNLQHVDNINNRQIPQQPSQRAMHVSDQMMPFPQNQPSQQNHQQRVQFQQQQPPRQQLLGGSDPTIRVRAPVIAGSQLPQHPIRTSELSGMLPAHLRFPRPNLINGASGGGLNPLATQLLFPNQNNNSNSASQANINLHGQPMRPASSASQNFMIHGNQLSPMGWLSNANHQGQHKNLGSNANKPQVLMHPQRFVATSFSTPNGRMGVMVNSDRNKQASSMLPSAIQAQQMRFTNGGVQPMNSVGAANDMMPSNVLIPRMSSPGGSITNSGEPIQVPQLLSTTSTTQAPISPPQASSGLSSSLPTQWLPSQSFVAQPLGIASRVEPILTHSLRPMVPEMGSQVGSESQDVASKKDRVLFSRNESPVVFSINTNANDESSFKPMLPILPPNSPPISTTSATLSNFSAQRTLTTTETNLPTTFETPMVPMIPTTTTTEQTTTNNHQLISSTDYSSNGSSSLYSAPAATANEPNSTSSPEQEQPTSVAASGAHEDPPSSQSATEIAPSGSGSGGMATGTSQSSPTQQPHKMDRESATTATTKDSSSSQLPVQTTSEQITSASVTTEQTPQFQQAVSTSTQQTPIVAAEPVQSNQEQPVDAGKKEEEDNTTTNNRNQEPETAGDFNPFGVSECNIYGKLYKVGQLIEQLSDKCNRCTCSSGLGVDCKNLC